MKHFVGITITILIAITFSFSFLQSVPGNDKTSMKLDANSWPNVVMPENLNFVDERVPLEYFDVKEALDRELLAVANWHSRTFLLIKRANRWFPMIERILKKNNIPEDFKYLAVAESGLINDVSPVGARGVWQFMEKTAIEYGLEVNKNVDERYHLEKATEAACRYLQKSYDKFGSWALVAAS
ncbi:MAG: lytic transglycosylase domain-containing protein, partial [Bacteroidales bacterium]|nr:lytic transglycosylase domain-containing protein [Bacteroidales bacterium]